MVEGIRSSVTSSDGVVLATLSAGVGPPLLLVHGGLGSIQTWQPLWSRLTARWRVTAFDRRGRGGSGDSVDYSFEREVDDIAVVAATLAREHGRPADLFAHSYGATCALAAAAAGAALRRIALYEPPGPTTVTAAWIERITGLLEDGRAGSAVHRFLTEIIGLSDTDVARLRNAAGSPDVLQIAAATMRREAWAILRSDPSAAASTVHQPVLLLVGERSPAWAVQTTRSVAGRLASSTVVVLPGQGHEAVTAAPDLVADQLERFFTTD